MFGSKKLPIQAAPESNTPSELEIGREKVINDLKVENPRANIPIWKWVLTLVGIYSGALLYGWLPFSSILKALMRLTNFNRARYYHRR